MYCFGILATYVSRFSSPLVLICNVQGGYVIIPSGATNVTFTYPIAFTPGGMMDLKAIYNGTAVPGSYGYVGQDNTAAKIYVETTVSRDSSVVVLAIGC